jgi:hypothetical protein
MIHELHPAIDYGLQTSVTKRFTSLLKPLSFAVILNLKCRKLSEQ